MPLHIVEAEFALPSCADLKGQNYQRTECAKALLCGWNRKRQPLSRTQMAQAQLLERKTQLMLSTAQHCTRLVILSQDLLLVFHKLLGILLKTVVTNLETATAEVGDAGLPAKQFVVVHEQGASQVQDTSCRQSSLHCAVLHASFQDQCNATYSQFPICFVNQTPLSQPTNEDRFVLRSQRALQFWLIRVILQGCEHYSRD